MRTVLIDRSLKHQPILSNTSQNTGHPTLTCNCRKRAHMPDMGHVVQLTDTVRMYNDPSNHAEPFSDEDRLTEGGTNGQRSQGVRQDTTD